MKRRWNKLLIGGLIALSLGMLTGCGPIGIIGEPDGPPPVGGPGPAEGPGPVVNPGPGPGGPGPIGPGGPP